MGQQGEASALYRPGVREVGHCCTTCMFYTWGNHPHISPHYVHGYCRAYMAVTGEKEICDYYRTCRECEHR